MNGLLGVVVLLCSISEELKITGLVFCSHSLHGHSCFLISVTTDRVNSYGKCFSSGKVLKKD